VSRLSSGRWRATLLPALVLLWCLAVVIGAQWRPVEAAGGADPRALAPSLTHPLGTDSLGRDLLARLLEGMRTTLLVGAGATLMALGLGTLYGTAAGLAGPRTDEALMRGVDVALALPYLLLVILLVSLMGRSLGLLLIALALVEWLPMARVVRAGVRTLRDEPYLEAARIMGARPARVLCAHLLPQLRAPLVVYATLMMPVVMMQEAFLSFLGLGVPPPLASWGTLIAEGLAQVGEAPWILGSAAGSLALFLLCLHAAGDQLARRRGLPRFHGRSPVLIEPLLPESTPAAPSSDRSRA
jgi:oligopeptide transport system permease protein